jgi:phospholipid/cholesterol/gamma-HCH transport system substrate-binding protein
MRIGYALVTLFVCIVLGGAVALAIERLAGVGPTGYEVRAVFDNSSFVIPGEQVKIAGAIVGTIHAIELTPDNKAALVLQITNRKFVPFHSDAHCEIGIESLLGEQFVQCTPTQPRAPGVAPAPSLPAIATGPNKGQHLLPVQNTTSPIGVDLIQNITRLPQQERLRLIIAGLGAGLAGNGEELNAALLRADPALQQTDKVIAVLASQDQTLARLTDESAQILKPLAAQRVHIGGFITHAGTVAVASAQESQAIQEGLQAFPPLLHQLGPAANRLTALADQMTPALESLLAQAPAINASLINLGPLATTSIPALKSLGTVAQKGETVFPRAYPLAGQLLSLSKPLEPLSKDIAATAQSFDNAGGIENVMRFIYYYTGSVNGENALGHYIRSHVTLGAIQRSSTPQAGSALSATFACSLVTNACPAFGGSADLADTTRTAGTARASDPKPAQPTTGAAMALLRYLLAP